jgi:hypothetical protein
MRKDISTASCSQKAEGSVNYLSHKTVGMVLLSVITAKNSTTEMLFTNVQFSGLSCCVVDVLAELTVTNTLSRDLTPCSLVKISICQTVFHNQLKTFKVKFSKVWF